MAEITPYLNELILSIILICLQITGIYFAIKINRQLGKSKFWLFVIIALSLTFIRRIIYVLEMFNIMESGTILTSIDRIYFPLTFWFFMCLGLYDLKKRIEGNLGIKKQNTKINKHR